MAMENLTASDGTTSQAELGEYRVIKGVGYQYCKANGAIAAYSACTVSNAGVATASTTTTATALGTAGGAAVIPQFAVADTEYFWGFAGPGTLREDDSTPLKVLAANVTAGNQLYSTATSGVLDDDSSGSTIKLNDATLVTTVTTQAATAVSASRKMLWK